MKKLTKLLLILAFLIISNPKINLKMHAEELGTTSYLTTSCPNEFKVFIDKGVNENNSKKQIINAISNFPDVEYCFDYLDSLNIDFNNSAFNKAKDYLDRNSSLSEIKDSLNDDLFESHEIEYALRKINIDVLKIEINKLLVDMAYSKLELHELVNEYNESDIEEAILDLNIGFNNLALQRTEDILNDNPKSSRFVSELLSEYGFTNEQIKHAINSTDWKQQALKALINELKNKNLSRQGYYNLLEDDGFRDNEIEYALYNVEIDFNENALVNAKDFIDLFIKSKKDLKSTLETFHFSDDEINYAINDDSLDYSNFINTIINNLIPNKTLLTVDIENQLYKELYTDKEIEKALNKTNIDLAKRELEIVTDLVVKAELSKDKSDYDQAFKFTNRLKESKQKQDLLVRLSRINFAKDELITNTNNDANNYADQNKKIPNTSVNSNLNYYLILLLSALLFSSVVRKYGQYEDSKKLMVTIQFTFFH